MDAPGLSLFQDAGSIQLNTTAQQRIEEDDDLEDQKRRNEELKDVLQNAFDDLDDTCDDDEEDHQSTIDNSTNFRHSSKFNGKSNGNKEVQHNRYDQRTNEQNRHDFENEFRRMKNALASKAEELKNVNAQFVAEKAKYEKQIKELEKRLAIAEAEKERAHMTRKQTHELIVESKQKLAEIEERNVELNAKIKLLEERNLELITELEHTKSTLSDVQHKYHMIERNASLNSDKHTDSVAKQLNDRHAAQVDMMQQQINTMRSKLEDRENELSRLKIQNNELQRSREAMLLDKSDMINQLTHKLEVSQRQCQNLLMKNTVDSDVLQENARLTRSMTTLEKELEEKQRAIMELTTRLEATTAELEQMTESAIYEESTQPRSIDKQLSNGIHDTPVLRNQNRTLSKSKRSAIGMSSTPLAVEEQLNRLKEEFNRCVAEQRSKRQEILALKEQVASQNEEILRLKADENKALIELNTNREQMDRLNHRLRMADIELKELKLANPEKTDNKSLVERLEVEVNRLREKNDNFRKNCNHLNETVKELEDERDQIEEKYRQACQELAELQRNLSALEQNSGSCVECGKIKSMLNDSQRECVRLKELYIRLSDEKDDVERKLTEVSVSDIQREIAKQRGKMTELEKTLELSELKCKELSHILDRHKIDYSKQIAELQLQFDQARSPGFGSKETKNTTNACTKCKDLAAQIAEFDVKNIELQNSCSNYMKQIVDLKKSLKQAHHKITDLEKIAAVKAEHDKFINVFKQHAKKFEEFMRNQSPTNHLSLEALCNIADKSVVRDQCVSTEDFQTANLPRPGSSGSVSSSDRAAEKRIRDEMARAMANEIKSAEKSFKEKLHDFEKRLHDLTVERDELKKVLGARDKDVSALKQCILSERAAIKEILEQKEAEAEAEIKEYKAALNASRERAGKLTRELDELTQQYQAERESRNKIMAEWKAELTAFAEREERLTMQMRQMQDDHRAMVQTLTEKYTAAKKTAANYKKYSEDKERHVKQESERLKMAYETATKRLKEKMDSVIKEHEAKANKRIAELQEQYERSARK